MIISSNETKRKMLKYTKLLATMLWILTGVTASPEKEICCAYTQGIRNDIFQSHLYESLGKVAAFIWTSIKTNLLKLILSECFLFYICFLDQGNTYLCKEMYKYTKKK